MSKELEALEALGRIKAFYPQWRLYNRNDFSIIEVALKEINEIMFNHNCSNLSELNEKLCDFEELKFDDDIKQKKLKALEIIKKKDFIDIKLLKKSSNMYEYNRNLAYRYDNTQRKNDICLIQNEEEYDLLKEYFK